MADISVNHDNAWTTDATLSAASIANGAGSEFAAGLSLDGYDGVIVSVEIAYGATVTGEATVYVLQDVDGTNYEAASDDPFAFTMPKASSSTRRRTVSWSASDSSAIKVRVANSTGATITATVRYKLFKSTSA